MENEWIPVKERLPKIGDNIEVSYDGGKTGEGTAMYLANRTCMMAGIAGGFGYFGEGFATDDSSADYGLIIDEPTHWRYISN